MLKRIPEPAAQRVPHLVMEQEVDRQGRSLKQPGLKVRRHPGLPGKHGFQPERGRVAGHRLAERLALLVRGLHRVGERDPGLTGIARRSARVLLRGRRRRGYLAQRGIGVWPLLAGWAWPTLLTGPSVARPTRTSVGGLGGRLGADGWPTSETGPVTGRGPP